MNHEPRTTIHETNHEPRAMNHDMKEAGFKKLKIWQSGMRIAKMIYEETRQFPSEERFGLTAQMRRSAVSIPSNIAEGFCRRNKKEFEQFLFIALGSLGELETQIILSKELGFMRSDSKFVDEINHERAMILKMSHLS